MLNNISLKRSMSAVCLAAASILFTPFAHANLEGVWVSHPSASFRTDNKEGQIDRIIDGERYVYFVVRGDHFRRSFTSWKSYEVQSDPFHLFRYDKTLPWAPESIEAVARISPSNGTTVRATQYSPRLGVMAVIYEDMSMDLLFDDGRTLESQALHDISVPGGSSTPFSITFDDSEAAFYIATGFGFMKVNADSGEVIRCVRTDMPVSWAGRVGDKMVLFAGDNVSASGYSTSTYVIPADTYPASLKDYQLILPADIAGITGSKALSNLQALMPLTDTSFAAISPGTADTNFRVILVDIGEEDAPRADELIGLSTVDNGASSDYRRMFRTDGFCLPSSDGFSISSQSDLWFVKSGVKADYSAANPIADFKSKALKSIPKTSLSATEKAAKCGSLDGSKVWFYTYDTSSTQVLEKGFYFREVADETFSDKSPVVAPNAPTMTYASYIEWHPDYGMLFRDPGTDPSVQSFGADLFCAYKDGKWTDISLSANYPAAATLSIAQRHIGIDPANPDWIWGAATTYGLLRMDLGDFTNNLMYLRNNRTNLKNYGGFPVYPAASEYWPIFLNFSNVTFDNDGTMWVVREHNFDTWYDQEDYLDCYIPLTYLTKEERLSMANIGSDQSRLIMPHELRIPHTQTYRSQQILALRHPDNKNLLVNTSGTNNYLYRIAHIYDHNGTLDNPDDDRVVFITDLTDQDGRKLPFQIEKGLYEDQTTGDVWLFTDVGPMIFDPKAILSGSKEMRRLHISRREGVEVDEFPLEGIEIRNIADDAMGRKWIATTDGLYCFSADNEELLAYFTAENSPLPADKILSVGCDMSNGAVFVGTERGIMEFRPAEGFITHTEGSLSIEPTQVTPGYMGYVTISGAVSGTEYVIRDSEGNEVVSLGKPEANAMQWNLKDSRGDRVAAGHYTVSPKNSTENNRITIIN